MRRFIRTHTILISILFCLMVGVCIIAIRYLDVLKSPNILLITIDALRADHIGSYGYIRNTTPYIDAFARDGVVFLNCYATSSSTVTATPGLMTGRYVAPSAPDKALVPLSKQFKTLAEYLNDAGYFTLGFTANGKYMGSTGYERGFDFYAASPKYFPEMRDDFIRTEQAGLEHDVVLDAARLTKQIVWTLRVLKETPIKKPWFIWVHYIDPHAPYTPHEEYLRLFKDDELWKTGDRMLFRNPDNNSSPHSSGGFIPGIVFQEGRYSLNYYRACYDSEIRYTDYHLEQLLKEAPFNTLVIITADHGESLGEHNTFFSHGANIHDELLHIPVIVKSPRSFKRGKKIDTAVSAVDIVPTILQEVRPVWYFFNRKRFDGVSLQKYLSPVLRHERKYIYSYSDNEWSIRHTGKNIKYVINKEGRESMYQLPDEDNDLATDHYPGITALKSELQEQLGRWRRKYPVSSDTSSKKLPIDSSVKGNLRSLGYLQ